MLATLLILGAGMLLVERLRPAWRLPRVRAWWARVAFLNLLQLGVVILAGLTWERWLAGRGPFDLSAHLGATGQGVAAYLVSTFVYYWWHRARHSVPALWRLCHQTHHAPQRLEVVTAFYKHPLEAACNGVISALIVYALLGCSVAGGAVYTLLAGAAELFYHWNVRTPRWLGYVIQRPEAHRLHHERGVHAGNYGDLPLWDLLFGTFRDPEREGPVDCGFEPKCEDRFEDQLAARDVHTETRPPLTFLPPALGCAGPRSRGRRVRAANLAAAAVLTLGLTQFVGAVTGNRVLRGVGAASAAAPLPKVFSAHRGFETFANDFELCYDRGGQRVRVPLTAERAHHLRGPYNRRNVYGAALSYGPLLPSGLLDPVLSYGLRPDGPLRAELGVPADAEHVTVEIHSKTRGREGTWTLASDG